MLVRRNPGDLRWIAVPEIERELAVIARSRPGLRDSMSIVYAVQLADELGVQLLSNKHLFELCVRHPEAAERAWRDMCAGNIVRTMLTGTFVFSSPTRQASLKYSQLSARGIDPIMSLDRLYLPDQERILTYAMPKKFEHYVGVIDHPDYFFEDTEKGVELTLKHKLKKHHFGIPICERVAAIDHIDLNARPFTRVDYHEYPFAAVSPSAFPLDDEPLFGALTTYLNLPAPGTTLFGQRTSQFIKPAAGLVVASRKMAE